MKVFWTLSAFLVLSHLTARVAVADDKALPWTGAKAASEKPTALLDVGIDEKTGDRINLEIPFTAEDGKEYPLSHWVKGDRPVFLSVVYYSCPGLCNYHLNGVTDALKQLKWTLGKEFDMVVVSMDASEKSDLAAEKKQSYLESYGRPEAAKGWHFLVGSTENIQALTKQIGFKFKWDEPSKQWAHASAMVALTPDGKISRYLHGVVFEEKNIRLALTEAGQGKFGSFIDKAVLFCFQYDPVRKTYAFYAYNIMKFGAGLTVLVMGAFLGSFWLRQRKSNTSTVQV